MQQKNATIILFGLAIWYKCFDDFILGCSRIYKVIFISDA